MTGTAIPTQPLLNEFQRIRRGGINEVTHFFDSWTQNYPLISMICSVAFLALGISTVLSFSFTALISGALLTAMGLAMGKNIFSDAGNFWTRVKPSLQAVFTCGAAGQDNSPTETQANNNNKN